MKAQNILTKAADTIAQRGKMYDKDGKAERSMPAIVKAFEAITGHDLTAEQGHLFMVLLKVVRSQQGETQLDNYLDGAAYFALAGEVALEQGLAPDQLGFDETRADVIGQNGNDGAAYEWKLDAYFDVVTITNGKRVDESGNQVQADAPDGRYIRQDNGLYRLAEVQ